MRTMHAVAPPTQQTPDSSQVSPLVPRVDSRRRRTRGRRIVVVLLAVTLLIGGAYLAAGFVVYNTLSSVQAGCGQTAALPSGRFASVTPASLGYAPGDFGDPQLGRSFLGAFDPTSYRMPRYQDVQFPSREPAGARPVTIGAWWVPAAPGAPSVVLAHGRDSCRRDWNVLLPAAMLHRAGFGVLLIDLRNMGSSTVTDGRYFGGLVEDRDVMGAVDWLEHSQGVMAGHIGVFGASLGAAAVIFAAEHDPDVAAIWEDSSYAATRQRVEEELSQKGFPSILSLAGGVVAKVSSGVDIYAESPLSAVRALTGRALFIAHGEADPFTLVHHAHDLFNAARLAGVNAQLWTVPGAGHTGELLTAPFEYERRLDAFFNTNLAGSSGR